MYGMKQLKIILTFIVICFSAQIVNAKFLAGAYGKLSGKTEIIEDGTITVYPYQVRGFTPTGGPTAAPASYNDYTMEVTFSDWMPVSYSRPNFNYDHDLTYSHIDGDYVVYEDVDADNSGGWHYYVGFDGDKVCYMSYHQNIGYVCTDYSLNDQRGGGGGYYYGGNYGGSGSGGYNSGSSGSTRSSSSSQICPSCRGTGNCSLCGGQGWYWQETGYYTGNSHKTKTTCPSCHGTGHCGTCHGMGKIR